MARPRSSIKYGDVFQIGSHTVACGDARDRAFVDRVIGARKIKSVIADVPYGVNLVQAKEGFAKLKVPRDILNDNITSEAEYAAFTADWITPILGHLERKNAFYVFNGDTMVFALREGMQKADVRFSQLLIWVKSHVVIGRRDYLPAHELIAYGWHGTHEFKKSKDSSLLFCPKPSRSPLHPSQKPVALIRRLILNSTSTGDTVYDCFAGSGTTAVAAEQTKRSSICIERDEVHCQAIIDRMAKLFGTEAKRV